MGDIKFYSPVDFDDTSSGVTIEGNLVANAGIGVGTTTVYSNSLNLNNSGTFRIGNAEMLSKSGNDLSVYQDKLRITSGGNVGIGTTSPGHKLDVAGRIHSANSGIDGGQIRLKNTGGGSTWYWSARTTGLNLGELTVADGQMFIENGGDVGIGTTSPGQKLHVNGNIRVGNSADVIYSNRFNGLSNADVLIGSNSGYAITFSEGASERMRINSSGNVGIGTTSPGSKLEVNGDITILDGNRLNVKSTGGTYTGYIEKDGYNGIIGLGNNTTFTSARRIYINDGTNQRWEFGGNSTAASDNIIAPGGGYTESSIYAGHLGNIGFFTRASTVAANVMQLFDRDDNNNHGVKLIYKSGGTYSDGLVLDNTGNVGIGTTSPSQKLEVVGNIDLDGDNRHIYFGGNNTFIGENSNSNKLELRGGGNSSSQTVYIDNAGQLGIGTSAPSQKLHVSGNARITGAIYDSNNSPGTSGQVLSSTASGTDWIDQGDVVVGSADKALSVTLTVKNTEAVALTKGQVVCAAPSASPPSGNLIEVKLADNNGTDSMPAIGVLNEGLDAAGGTNDEGEAIMFGKVSGIDTSAFDVGDEVFVSDTAGGLTKTKPTGVKYIQKIGVVIRDHASNGTIEVFGAGRTNDVPTPLYIDHANQRLGIGTTSPGQKLTVDGDVGITTSNQLFVNDIAAYTGAMTIGPTGASELKFRTSGSEKMRITSAGNVGIGTTSPAQKLHVNGNFLLENNNEIRQKDSGGTERTIIELDSSNDLNIGGSYAGALKFIGGGSYAEVMRIHDNGNVGIGTTSPTEKLSVDGDVSITTGGNTYLDVNHGNVGFIKFTDTSISTPNTFLIQHNYAQNNDFRIARSTGGADFVINTDGNVGIGTSSPAYKLDLKGESTAIRVWDNSDSVNSLFAVDNSGAFQGTFSNHPIRIFTNSSERIRITPAGNVGIGTTSPNYKLHVEGDVRIGQSNRFYINNSNVGIYRDSNNLALGGYQGIQFHVQTTTVGSQAERMRIDSSGRVGIGTTSPTEKLHVVGDAKIEDDLHVEGDLHLEGDIGFRVINSGGFGQPEIELPNFADVFYRADRRFTVTVVGGASVSGLFDGTYSNLINLVANTTHKITINVANQSGVSANGFTYPQGYIYISFYSTTNNYDSISGRVKDRNGVYYNMSGLTDIIPNGGNYKVMRLTVPSNNYAVEYEITVVTAADNVRLSAINYVSTRHTSQMELPYLSKTLDTNRLFGNVDVLTNASVAQNRLSGTGNSYLNANTGNVGIGTTTPGEKLVVQDGKVLAGHTNTKGYGFHDLSNYAYTANTGRLSLVSNGIEAVSIDSSQRVGVGTTSPGAKLHVFNAGYPQMALQSNTGTWQVGVSTGNDLAFRRGTSGSNYPLWLDSSDNVGIGTTSPQAKLEVGHGDINIGSTLATVGALSNKLNFWGYTAGQGVCASIGSYRGNNYVSGGLIFETGELTTSEKMRITPGGNVGIGTTAPDTTLHVLKAGTEQAKFAYDATNYTYVNYDGIDTFGGSQTFSVSGSEKMRITSAGNVGIGTTSPGAKLDVQGTILVNNEIQFVDSNMRIYRSSNDMRLRTGGGDRVTILSNGNVLIGTTTDNGDKLTVEGNISGSGTGSFESVAIPGTTADYYIGGSGGGAATNELRIGSTHTPNNIALELYHSLNPVSLGIGYSNGGGLAFIESVHGSYDTNTHMLFKPGGAETWRIGSHGSSVSNKFQIQPAAAANDFVIADNSGNAILYSDTSTQRIGIGTTTPSEKLDVVGTTKSAGLHITGATRIDQGGGTAPIPLPNQAPTDAIAAQGIQGTNIFLSEPDEWLVINIGGADYVIPAYLT